jgi:hypothetical protein
MSERIVKAIPDVGYISVEAGDYTVVHFASNYEASGYDTFQEACEDLELVIANYTKETA